MAIQIVKNEVAKLELLSNDLDSQKQKFAAQNKLVTALIKQHNLTKARFNFGLKSFKYTNSTVPGSVTQDCIKKAIKQFYPQLDPELFITNAKRFRKSRLVEKMELTRNKP